MTSFLRRLIPRRPPTPPEHVRWVYPDDTEVPLDCAYLGTQKQPGQRWPWKRQHCWGVTVMLDVNPLSPDTRGHPAVKMLPPHTIVIGGIQHTTATDRGVRHITAEFVLGNPGESPFSC